MSTFDLNEMNPDLSDRTVAILATDGFEQSELESPRDALLDAGAEVKIISLPDSGTAIRGWADGEWGDQVDVDGTVRNHSSADFDALVLPGGVINPDKLRADEAAVGFVRDFFSDGKPVAAICHGPWLIVEAGAAEGRRMTSYHSIRTDVTNAGAHWVDESVVVDQGLVTSRNPGDLEDFNYKLLEEINEGVHSGQHA
jgi:protease I